MYVRKFEGDTLDEALQAVKSELGPDAIILKTVTNKGLKGAFKKNRIEITAAISEQSYTKKAKVDKVLTPDQQQQFYKAPASRVNNMINEYNGEEQPSQGGYGSMGLNKVVKTVSKASNKIKSSLDDFLAEEEQESESEFNNFLANPAERSEPQVERSSSQTVAMGHVDTNAQEELEMYRHESQEVSSELKQQLKSQNHQIELLEKKLFELGSKLSESNVEKREAKGISLLKNTFRSLDLSEIIVQQILRKAQFELTKEELEDEDIVFEFGLKEINEIIQVEQPKFSTLAVQDKPCVTVLLSECSNGQSSMAMKLGVLQENVKIIKFREQNLDRANSEFTAQFFNLDIVIVNTLSFLMSESRKAVQEKKSIILDLKLNFKDKDETKKFIDTLKRSFDDIEILVNISAIQSEIYNRKILSKYNQFSNGVIISYMDQCLSFGSLINLHYDFNEKPLKFFGTGVTVPDDIEAATAERILAGMFQL